MDKKFDSEDCNHIASLVAGLCHLLKNSGESEILNLWILCLEIRGLM